MQVKKRPFQLANTRPSYADIPVPEGGASRTGRMVSQRRRPRSRGRACDREVAPGALGAVDERPNSGLSAQVRRQGEDLGAVLHMGH
jgi:hypothetical protein